MNWQNCRGAPGRSSRRLFCSHVGSKVLQALNIIHQGFPSRVESYGGRCELAVQMFRADYYHYDDDLLVQMRQAGYQPWAHGRFMLIRRRSPLARAWWPGMSYYTSGYLVLL